MDRTTPLNRTVRFTKHALVQIKRRGIPFDEIDATVDDPSSNYPDVHSPNRKYERTFGSKRLTVVLRVNEGYYDIITAYYRDP